MGRCQHRYKNGERCGNSAAKGCAYCWRHRSGRVMMPDFDETVLCMANETDSTCVTVTPSFNTNNGVEPQANDSLMDESESEQEGCSEEALEVPEAAGSE